MVDRRKCLGFYALSMQGENSAYLQFPQEPDYFQRHFVGKPMKESWTPPHVAEGSQDSGEEGVLVDFISWTLRAPVCSESAAHVMETLIAPYAELLLLTEIRGVAYLAINVTCLVDCLDVERSDIRRYDDGRIYMIRNPTFDPSRYDSQPIFKITQQPDGRVYVSEDFATLVKRNGLTGVRFADPTRLF